MVNWCSMNISDAACRCGGGGREVFMLGEYEYSHSRTVKGGTLTRQAGKVAPNKAPMCRCDSSPRGTPPSVHGEWDQLASNAG